MKKYNFAVSVFTLILSFVLVPRFCDAREWNRNGKAEIFVLGQYLSGDTTSGSGIMLEFDDAIATGFAAGYNINDYLNLNTDIFFSSMDVATDGFGTKTESGTTIFGWDLGLDINILKNLIPKL